MTREELIIRLIQQDFMHLQLLNGIHNLGFENDGVHYLGILDIVINLMEFDETDYPLIDRISETYFKYEKKATECPITYTSEELIPVATECYHEIRELCANQKS